MTSTWHPDKSESVEPDFAITPQLMSVDMAQIKAAGFRSVINNRPDFEGGPGQPRSAELETAARAEGLTYHHLPVPPSGQADDDARRMVDIVDASPKPVLAFCRTGKRAAHLYRKGKALA